MKIVKADDTSMFERIILKVADEEQFDVRKLPAEFDRYFRKVNRSKPRRCVDERQVLEQLEGQSTGFTNAEYNGSQTPGGTSGDIDVTKKVAGVSEEEGRIVVEQAYINSGRRMGLHKDNKHGHITNLDELESFDGGCGNKDKKADGKLPMYSPDEVNPEIMHGRNTWFKTKNTPVIPLADVHTAQKAAINLIEEDTFDNLKGLEENHPLFNCDLGDTALLADSIHGALNAAGLNKKGVGDQEFREKFVEETVRDYFQTLTALRAGGQIHIRK